MFGKAIKAISELVLFTNPKFIKFIKKGFRLNPGSKEAYTNASQLIGAMISNNLISKDEGEDYLEELRKSREEDILGTRGQLPIEPTPSEPVDIDLSIKLEQVSNVSPLNTPNINPNLFAQAPTGIMQNLTNTERAFTISRRASYKTKD